MVRFLFLLLVFYLLYKLVFDLIIPVSRATSQVRHKMQEMQDLQQAQMRQQQQQQQKQQSAGARPSQDDYIDFEEVKGS